MMAAEVPSKLEGWRSIRYHGLVWPSYGSTGWMLLLNIVQDVTTCGKSLFPSPEARG